MLSCIFIYIGLITRYCKENDLIKMSTYLSLLDKLFTFVIEKNFYIWYIWTFPI